MKRFDQVVDRRVVENVVGRMNTCFFGQFKGTTPVRMKLKVRQNEAGRIYVGTSVTLCREFLDVDAFCDVRTFLAEAAVLLETFPYKGWVMQEPCANRRLDELDRETAAALAVWENAANAVWKEKENAED